MYRLNSIIILDQWDHKVMSSYSGLLARAPQLPCQVPICITLVSVRSLRSTQTNTSCAGHIRLYVPLSTRLLYPLSIPISFLSLHGTRRRTVCRTLIKLLLRRFRQKTLLGRHGFHGFRQCDSNILLMALMNLY